MRRHASGVGAAPAGGARNPALGRPRPAVRPHYGGLPLMAGRGGDEGRRKLPGSGAPGGPVAARKHGAGDRNRRDGAPRGALPPRKRKGHASPACRAAAPAAQEASQASAFLGAPLPSQQREGTSGKGRTLHAPRQQTRLPANAATNSHRSQC